MCVSGNHRFLCPMTDSLTQSSAGKRWGLTRLVIIVVHDTQIHDVNLVVINALEYQHRICVYLGQWKYFVAITHQQGTE